MVGKGKGAGSAVELAMTGRNFPIQNTNSTFLGTCQNTLSAVLKRLPNAPQMTRQFPNTVYKPLGAPRGCAQRRTR